MGYLERLKRQLPINALKALQLEKNENLKRIIPKEGDGFIVRFVERHDDSDFFFEVTGFEKTSNGDGFNCRWKPRDARRVGEYKNWLKLEGFENTINNWVNVVASYDQINNTPFDDPILKGHKEWFSEKIQLVDTDDEQPFTVNQILLILEHYEKLQDELRKLEGVSEKEVEGLILEIEAEKQALGFSPKRKSFDSMLTIWARIARNYPTVLKFIVDTFTAWGLNEVFNRVLKSIEGG